MNEMAEVKASMEEEVGLQVLDPMHKLVKGDMKQVSQHVKARDQRRSEAHHQRLKMQRKRQKYGDAEVGKRFQKSTIEIQVH